MLHVISFSDCAVTITKPFGVITSPGFPQFYKNGIDCTWHIQLSFGLMIQFNFLHFDVEYYLNCWWDTSVYDIFSNQIDGWFLSCYQNYFVFRFDSLNIYDGASDTSPMLGNPYCGDSLPPSQISSSNHLFFHFHSDHKTTETGFKLEYNATSKSPYKVV